MKLHAQSLFRRKLKRKPFRPAPLEVDVRRLTLRCTPLVRFSRKSRHDSMNDFPNLTNYILNRDGKQNCDVNKPRRREISLKARECSRDEGSNLRCYHLELKPDQQNQ